MKLTRRHFIGKCLAGSSAIGIPGVLFARESEPRSLFDGKTLQGWHTTPRVYVPSRVPRFADIPAEDLKTEVLQYYLQKEDPNERAKAKDHGVWKVQDGAIVGGQTPNSKRGAYLLSNEKFGDFELTLDANPDWPVDTGIMVRAHELGSVGFQILLDHRPGGSIGGVYGNSTGNFRAYPFVLDGDEQDGFKVANMRSSSTDKDSFKPDYAASVEDFLAIWRPNRWNTFRIHCIGRLPVIKVWINDTLISQLDTGQLSDQVAGYDPETIFKLLGRTGHIGFEVHDNDSMGYNRWAPGAVCRWKNIQLKDL